jgi:hypothetical protein
MDSRLNGQEADVIQFGRVASKPDRDQFDAAGQVLRKPVLGAGTVGQRTNSGKQNCVGARAVGAQAVLLPLLVMMSSQEADHWHIEILKEVVRLASHLPWTDRLCDFAGAQVR